MREIHNQEFKIEPKNQGTNQSINHEQRARKTRTKHSMDQLFDKAKP